MIRIHTSFVTLLAMVQVLSGASLAHAQGLNTLEGIWSLQSFQINGKVTDTSKELYGLYKPGAKWNLAGDGTGDCGGTTVKWSYDPMKKKINLQLKNFFGFWVTPIADGDVTATEKGASISCSQFGQAVQISLVSDSGPAVTVEDASTTFSVADGIVDREVFSEIIETAPGLPKKLTVRREYETVLSNVTTVGTEVGGEITVGPKFVASLSAELKAKVEVALGITLGKKDEVTESYELDGEKVVKVKVKWVERYRKGTMSFADGTTRDFLVCVGLRTIPEIVR